MAVLLRADLEAVHAGETSTAAVEAAARAAGVKLRLLGQPTLARIIEAAQEEDVVAVVIGARATLGRARPLGHIATGVATSVRKPVVVVPSDCACPIRLRRMLVPLEAVMDTSAAVAQIIRPAGAAGTEVVVLHVFEEDALPLFTDQPQHEVDAWVGEFVRTYCPVGVRVELRAGVTRDHVLETAEAVAADALVLGWGQRLEPGRASLVKMALERSRIPVILVPVPGPASGRDQASAVSALAHPG
jgi:nucleotide-binding universal stress UspA family protein